MNIRMAGIDHTRAAVDERSRYAFTRSELTRAYDQLRTDAGLQGCVILSTCNRTEIYVSAREGYTPDLPALLSALRGETFREPDRALFGLRENEDAVHHLMQLAGGLESMILGEDQILTQVGEAVRLARECAAADHVLEVLFRQAVTAGKRIRSETHLSGGDKSAIDRALSRLASQGFDVKGRRCLVIGNGMMGRLCAQSLTAHGAAVTVTVRRYRSGVVDIPFHCERMDYTERYGFLPRCDLAVSATTSPNYTVTAERMREVTLTHPLYLLDLAVPRDIEREVGDLDNVTLLDLDDLGGRTLDAQQETELGKARQIIGEEEKEVFDYVRGRDLIPRMERIRSLTAQGAAARLPRSHGQSTAPAGSEAQAAFEREMNHLLFELRDQVPDEVFRSTLAALERIYVPGKETLRIGSRESALAVAQSRLVIDALERQLPGQPLRLVTMKTTGDRILDRTLDKVGGKGLFVRELDAALNDGRADLTVHSLKDVPMELPADRPLIGYSRREDPLDVLVLPAGAEEIDFSKPIGSASRRRVLQLQKLFPQAQFSPVRGNLQTRLHKLDEGQYGALVLAGAGLRRLGLGCRISRVFTPDEVIPAAGQGIVAVQSTAKLREEWLAAVRAWSDPESELSAAMERACVRVLNGGCSSPVCAFASLTAVTEKGGAATGAAGGKALPAGGWRYELRALNCDETMTNWKTDLRTGQLSGTWQEMLEQARQAGEALARDLKSGQDAENG